MSHSTLMLVTETESTDAVIAEALAPFDENGNGRDVDVTAKERSYYETATIRAFRAPDGSVRDAYGDEFMRPATPDEIHDYKRGGSKDVGKNEKGDFVRFAACPVGWTDEQVPATQVYSFLEYLRRWSDERPVVAFGTPEIPGQSRIVLSENGDVERVISYHNPDAKWDWYQVGGRWTNSLLLKNGLCTNAARKGDVDFVGMQRANLTKRREYLYSILDKLAQTHGKTPNEIMDQHLDAAAEYITARNKWQEAGSPGHLHDWLAADPAIYPCITAARGGAWSGYNPLASGFDSPLGPDTLDVEGHLAKGSLVSTFAFLRGGVWSEHGEMGWFAIVRNEKDNWQEEFEKLLAAVPNDHWITILDIHI